MEIQIGNRFRSKVNSEDIIECDRIINEGWGFKHLSDMTRRYFIYREDEQFFLSEWEKI